MVFDQSEQNEKSATVIRPQLNAFAYYKFAISAILYIAVLSIIYFGINAFFKISALYLWVPLIVLAALRYITLSARYKKAEYILYPDRLVQKGGGIFSDFERELSIKNVTHINMKLPFPENRLFGTGYIRVESAGAAATEILLSSVDKTNSIYEGIIKLMRQNGFKLTRENLVQKERPHDLAVFFEVFRSFAVVVFVLIWIISGLAEEHKQVIDLLLSHTAFLILGICVCFVVLLIRGLFQFLDLKRRVYELYEDTVAYSGGFLNVSYSLIPIENLADSAVVQSFISKIFNLYDVKLSCQGSGQEILFKNISNGELLSENIDKLIAKKESLFTGKQEPETARMPGQEPARGAKKHLQVDKEYAAEFRMDPLRTWMPAIFLSPLLIVIFPAGIIAAINNAITISSNIFKIKENAIEHTFSFMSRKTKEFSFDKITGIIFKENFIDKLLRTCSIVFWSIGSGTNITFKNIKKTDELKQKILAKDGIRPQDLLYELKGGFRLLDMLKGNLFANLLFLIPVAGCIGLYPVLGWPPLALLVFLFGSVFVYKSLYYANHTALFYEDYVHFKRGLIFKEEYFTLYDDTKDITTTRYPFSKKGNIKFNIAGETVIQTKQGASRKSNSFTIRYVSDITVLDELIDTIFYTRPSSEKIQELRKGLADTSSKPIYQSRPCLSNYLSPVLIGLLALDVFVLGCAYFALNRIPDVVIYVIAALSIIVITAVVVTVKAISYNIQQYRAYARSGIVYKRQLSIIFDKIDFINFEQGPMNKIFGNGNITINTTGSSMPEMVIRNIKDYKQFYETLKKNYK